MGIFPTLFLSLALILNSIEFSAQSKRSSEDEITPLNPLAGASSSPARSVRRLRSNSPGSPARPSPSIDSSLRGRSRSPVRHSTLQVLGCPLQHLKYIRLFPKKNLNRRFQIQRYTFPRDKPINFRGITKLEPMPTEEQSVLSTSNGDVFAILYNNSLRGIYARGARYQRAKINMNSGEVKNMTPEEVIDSPVKSTVAISRNFNIVVLDEEEYKRLGENVKL